MTLNLIFAITPSERQAIIREMAQKSKEQQTKAFDKNKNHNSIPSSSSNDTSVIKKPIAIIPSEIETNSNQNTFNQYAPTPKILINPMKKTIFLKPNETIQDILHIQNLESKPILVNIESYDWTKNQKKKENLWLHLDDSNSIEIQPNETKLINLQISAPNDARGELITQIYIKPYFKESLPGMLNSRIGSLWMIVCDGTETLEIRALEIKRIASKTFELTLESLSNVHLILKMDIELISPLGIEGKTKLKKFQRLKPNQKNQIKILMDEFTEYNGNMLAKITIYYGIKSISERTQEFVIPVQ